LRLPPIPMAPREWVSSRDLLTMAWTPHCSKTSASARELTCSSVLRRSDLNAPASYTYGTSGMGIIEGPSNYGLDTALLKDFRFREGTYLQFRFEAFNMPNFVNLGSPDTTINDGRSEEHTSEL